jgi:hypothetical protein
VELAVGSDSNLTTELVGEDGCNRDVDARRKVVETFVAGWLFGWTFKDTTLQVFVSPHNVFRNECKDSTT